MTEEAEERVSRYRALTNGVFTLALALSAFSLVISQIRGLEDIIMALIFFANSFIIILGIWHDVHRILKYPFGMSFAALLYLLTFLVVLMPFTLHLLLIEIEEVREIAAILYPFDIMASAILLAAMYQSFVDYNWDRLPKELILWGKEGRNFMLIIAVFYTASLLLPSDVKLLPLPPEAPQFLQRAFLWWLAWPIAIIYGAIYEKTHGIKF